jgi:transcriptional regulator with XRE-family HTH domain
MKNEVDLILRNRIKDILIECRTEKDVTQTEVGKAVGKSKNAVASWEQGLSLPDIVTLHRLAKYYGKTLAQMYGDEK